jgi:hypothetical protein
MDIKYIASPKEGNPGELSAAIKAMQERTSMLRAVYGGTQTMRAKEKDFLPQYEKESDTRYAARLASTFALNKMREAVDAASAKPFRTLLKLNNADPELELWSQDIDMQGNHMHIFGHQLFNNALIDGMAHILVDHPSTANMKNLGEQRASGARPFFKLFKVDDVAAAYDQYVAGDNKTVHVRIRGQRAEREGFKEVLYNEMRVIEVDPNTGRGIVQLWDQKAGAGASSWNFIEETPIDNMTEVPFATLYAGEKEADYLARPVFIDLAYKQIEHWISSSDQRSILSAGRFPMLACSGVQLDEDDEKAFGIGPFKVLYAPEANGRWYYVEPRGTAIESGFKDLEHLEIQMDMMALNPIQGTHRQYVAQNERDLAETRVASVIHDLALNCQDTLEKAVGFMANWTGKDYSNVTVVLNKEFSNTKDRLGEVNALIKAWEKRGVSRELLLKELRNRSMFGDDFIVEVELAAIAAENAAGNGVEPGAADPAAEEADPAAGTDEPLPDFPAGQTRPQRQI